MTTLYKFRSGLILALDRIIYVQPPKPAIKHYAAQCPVVHMGDLKIDISLEDYDELVEKCERYL